VARHDGVIEFAVAAGRGAACAIVCRSKARSMHAASSTNVPTAQSTNRFIRSIVGKESPEQEASFISPESLDTSYFDRVYAATVDPWNFASSPYEAEKYRSTLAALPQETFGRALEIGCSIGVLTAQLAPRCTSLLSVDLNAKALAEAKQRCADLPNVRFAQMALPGSFPAGPFDLVLLSEVGYYWSDDDLQLGIERIAIAASGGLVELVHFLPKVEDYPRDGDSVHDAFLADPRYASIASKRAERYRIDVLRVR